ncbi:hypothetical protein FLAG1_08469 [Fusarium langsethiae]|uniref:Secreted protein n=1 Tax=Fusarium langsethiae TaxID=179993 RepID=A0A0N0DCS9_FUSLA|nr:hypothetical protein FLAG1_08469 [Fusarium langsethiae]GKU05578.1 unnamed protein product [Fusarium langsethiae]GKU22468.1 unnamed protein product [Fusarium langsethiae]
MHFTTAFASLVLLASSASAACHGSGINWPGAYNVMLSEAENECRRGAFTGVFQPGMTKYKCVQYGNGVKLEFSVRNGNTNTAFDLGDDDCVKEFRKDIYDCSRGGYHTSSGWEFSADPNEGRC